MLTKRFIKTPTATALLAEQLRGIPVRAMERLHLGITGQRKV